MRKRTCEASYLRTDCLHGGTYLLGQKNRFIKLGIGGNGYKLFNLSHVDLAASGGRRGDSTPGAKGDGEGRIRSLPELADWEDGRDHARGDAPLAQGILF